MKQPIEPKQEDCCNSGCKPCIFDVYEKQLRLYQSYIDSGENSDSHVENAMSQLEYSTFYVIKKIEICKQHSLLLFKQQKSVPGKQIFWSPAQHFLVKHSFLKNSCTRAYTPIKLERLEEIYDFAVIVKRYNNGLVSNYLCDLNVGELTLWRGPYGNYEVDSDKFSRIIMIAQGTGIAPLFSVIQHYLSDEDSMMRICLLYCCKCLETVLLRDELYSLKSYWNFEYVIHLSNDCISNEQSVKNLFKYKEPISTDRLTINDLLKLKPFTETDQFLLCGSDEFMKHYNKLLLEHVQNENIVIF